MMKKTENRVGKKFKSNHGMVELIEYFSCTNCTFRFEDGTILKNREYGDLKKGYVRNPNYRSVCGVGYLGEGEYKGCTNKHRAKSYLMWKNILLRCYETDADKFIPRYKNCTVSEEWHNYQNFAKWYEDNYIEGFEIDKDLLVKGNKIYGPDTCCFIPQEINNTIRNFNKPGKKYPTGVTSSGRYFMAKISIGNKLKQKLFRNVKDAYNYYKNHKENRIKELGEKYKNLLSNKAYKALINYNIDDLQ